VRLMRGQFLERGEPVVGLRVTVVQRYVLPVSFR
jgi:hypothetical protein